jgi:natural product biosynthesis luciferase-like monooxygenase protein
MATPLAELLGVAPSPRKPRQPLSFSLLFFSDVRKDIPETEKYKFMRDVTVFADQKGFTAIYIPERHFNEFGSIYANSAIIASYLAPLTKRIRFRTAGISLPLHHPAEVVEWWAMVDNLSGGRVDLGFGSGWSKPDFVLAPEAYENRRELCAERIELVRKLWRGESVSFPGPGNEGLIIRTYPRPIQKELNVWILVTQNEAAFAHAGEQGFNVFTMLYGIDLAALGRKIAIYRDARKRAGFDPNTGIVSLMLHTFLHRDMETVREAVELPFREYIRSSVEGHVGAGLGSAGKLDKREIGRVEKEQILDYAYQRYFSTGAIFGTVHDGKKMVDKAVEAGVNDIAFLVDFGVDYEVVKESLPYLEELISAYR